MSTQPIRKIDDDILPGKRHPGRRMTEAQFEAWIDKDTRAEWVNGVVVMMSPANRDHSDIARFLVATLAEFVQLHDLGEVYGPEYQVRLTSPPRRRTPDVLFIAKRRLEIVHFNYADGPPDLVMEVVSPDSISQDFRDKFLDYQTAGVREYWVIDPANTTVEAFILKAGGYVDLLPRKGRLASTVVKGYWIKLDWLWQRPLPTIGSVMRQLKRR